MLRAASLRRNLKPAQAAKLGNEYKKKLAADMRKKKQEGGKKGGEKSGKGRRGEPETKHAVNLPHPSTNGKKTRAPGAREQAAALAGTTPKAIDQAAEIERKAPDVYAKMGTGEIPTIAAAKKAAGIKRNLKAETTPKQKPEAAASGEPAPAAAAIATDQAELLPCPFCGAVGKHLEFGDMAVKCYKCGAKGPDWAADEKEGRASWNKRAKQ
jgi:hypothetical protein